MLQELAARTGGSVWTIASMLFFLAVYLLVTVRVLRARRDEMDAHARLVLDDDRGKA